MELSKSAQEVITQAQMLRLEGDSDQLCQEHILYGLLLMACYLDPPMNGTEYREEAKELRKFLLTKMHCISAPKTKLRLSALNNDKGLFVDGSATIGRAAEIAGSRPITPLDLAKAVHENPSMVVKAMSAVNLPGTDKKYEEKKPEPAVKPQQAAISSVQSAPVKPKPTPSPAPKPTPKPPQNNGSGDADLQGIVQAFQALDRLNAARKPQKPRKRRTKIGLITYRGGTVAALLQYFLLLLVIPAATLFAVEHFTGYVCAPPAPWIAFAVRAVLLIWAFLVARGIWRIVGLWSKSFSLFLRVLTDLALIAWLTVSVKSIFSYPEYPLWIKIVSGVLGILVLSFGTALYEMLNYTDAQKRRSIKYSSNKGPVPKVIFKTITGQLLLPLAAAVGLWAYNKPLDDWVEKTYWIIGFICVWNIPNTVFSCLHLRYASSWCRDGHEGFFTFLRALYTFLFIPLLVLFLHWLFGWCPVQLWVWIVLGVYTLLTLIGSISYGRHV